MNKTLCPVCQSPIPFDPRYPRAVCSLCMGKAVDREGRRVNFYNTDLGGGLSGRYEDDGSEYTFTQCLIDGFGYQAEERRLGGIVIQITQ